MVKMKSFKINGAEKKGAPLMTNKSITWCPGCPDHIILESSRRAILSLMKQGYKRKNFAMVAGVGCHGKIFDYLNVSGVYGLHGRAIPTAIGIKLGNPNLDVLVFAGDGDTYSEGMAHFIHACRFNPDMTLIVFDNQSFSLTTGQATPTSQLGFKTKAEPFGEFNQPLNPIHLALSAGASFVARCYAEDISHTQKVIEEAVKHVGFSFVEVIQDCIVFNLDANERDEYMYKIPDKNRSLDKSLFLSREYNYNLGDGKIPLGIFYKKHRPALHEEWPQLAKLRKLGVGWKGLDR
jgi:2-oxoglutarate/2-oxoacid ferredoxin oxidoreductase subunit beta